MLPAAEDIIAGQADDDRRTRTPEKDLEPREQIAVVRHLLAQPPDERPHQHSVDTRRQRQPTQEVRRRRRPVHRPAGQRSTAEDEDETHRDER